MKQNLSSFVSRENINKKEDGFIAVSVMKVSSVTQLDTSVTNIQTKFFNLFTNNSVDIIL